MNFKLLLAVLITIAASPSMGQGSLIGSSIDTSGTPIQKEELRNEGGKQSTSLLVRPGQPVSLASRVNQLEVEFREKIEEINTKTSRKSQHQEREIEVLKTLLEEEKKFSKQLSGRISQLEASTNPNSMENDQLLKRQKRPYRLIPPHIPIEKDSKHGERNRQFYGPATNCDELGLLGYTLNGYYLVKKAADPTKKGAIAIVYCRFQQLQGIKQATTSYMRTLVYLEDSELEARMEEQIMEKQARPGQETRDEMEELKTKNIDQSKRIDQLEQKLSMLQKTSSSPQLIRANTKYNKTNGISNNMDGLLSTSSTPPSSCNELSMLGYIMDGLFLVKNKETKKIQTVFCQFSADNQVLTSDRWTLVDFESFQWDPINMVPKKTSDCTYNAERKQVQCKYVSIENIKAFFQRNDFTINEILDSTELTLFLGDEWIPADILGEIETEKLVIEYRGEDTYLPVLKVNINAFQSTQHSTKTLKLINFNITQLNMGFLSGFNQLTDLEFHMVDQIQLSLPTLPLLPKLTSLVFSHVYGFNDSIITFPPLSTSGLKRFELYSGDHNDASVSHVLNWILLSSAKTLKSLEVRHIKITEIPSQIPSFTALESLSLNNNSISTIKNGAMQFSVPVTGLWLDNNKINLIEPGAFQGDFSNANVDMDQNSLTRFDEAVFRPMLEQMASGRGKIDFRFGNNIDCSAANICHLAWVIRDSKLRKKALGKCSNGTDFSELEFKKPFDISTYSTYSEMGNKPIYIEETGDNNNFVVVKRKTGSSTRKPRTTGKRISGTPFQTSF